MGNQHNLLFNDVYYTLIFQCVLYYYQSEGGGDLLIEVYKLCVLTVRLLRLKLLRMVVVVDNKVNIEILTYSIHR